MRVETLAEQLFFVTVPIWASNQDRDWTATGFLMSVPVKHPTRDDAELITLITNAHVVNEATSIEIGVHLSSDGETWLMGKGARIVVADLVPQPWTTHPNPQVDVAVIPAAPLMAGRDDEGNSAFFRKVTHSVFLDAEKLDALDALEEVVFIGYPSGIFDPASLLPVMRRGSTATPLAIDYRGVPSFLMDASVFPGSSGSPVFILNQGMFHHRGNTVVGNRLILIGILGAVHIRAVHGDVVEVGSQSIAVLEEPVDLGIVYRTDALLQTIDVMIERLGLLKRVEDPPTEDSVKTGVE